MHASSQSAGAAGDWKKYEAAHGTGTNYAASAGGPAKTTMDWHKYLNASSNSYYEDNKMDSSDTYSGPFHSDDSILKLKGNVTALKAKKQEVEHSMDLVDK